MTEVFKHASIAETQSWKEIVLLFSAAGALATHGEEVPLNSVDSAAANQVILSIGNGTPASGGAWPTAASAQALVKKPDGSALSADETLLATGLVNYLDEIEVLADAAQAITFAVNCGASSCKMAELEIFVARAYGTPPDGVDASVRMSVVGPSLDLSMPVTLGSASEIIKTGTTEIDLDTDKLVCVNGIVSGCFTVPEAGAITLAAGTPIVLRLWVKI